MTQTLPTAAWRGVSRFDSPNTSAVISPSEPSTPAASCADASALAETSVSRGRDDSRLGGRVPPGFGEHLLGAAQDLTAVLAEVAQGGADVRSIAAFDRRRLGVAHGAGGIEERGDVVAVAGGDDVQRPVGERGLRSLPRPRWPCHGPSPPAGP